MGKKKPKLQNGRLGPNPTMGRKAGPHDDKRVKADKELQAKIERMYQEQDDL